MKKKDKTENIQADEHKQRTINVTVDHSKPVLDMLGSAINDFMFELLEGCPRTYYVKFEMGNDRQDIITIPVGWVFKGNGDPLDHSEVKI